MASSYVVAMIALGYGITEAEVLPMLQRWRAEEGLTHQAISTRLQQKNVQASPQRISELLLEAMGDDRPPKQTRRAPA